MRMDKEGIIPKCKEKSSKCKYKCCKFTNNFIALYPGEFENSKLKKDNIKIIDNNYNGGKKAICLKHCIPNHFKPLDCKFYPLFPLVDINGNLKLIKGIKCSLKKKDLIDHEKWVRKKYKEIIKNPKIKAWLKKVKLVGYEEYQPHSIPS